MSDVAKAMLNELRRIRELLEAQQALGFGRRRAPVHVFVKYHSDHLWYWRDKDERENHPIYARDLQGVLLNLWRHERRDQQTGQLIPRLQVLVKADKDYLISSGFHTNFSRSLLAALLELRPTDLHEPLSLLVESNEGSQHRPTVFCRIEQDGQRLQPQLNKGLKSRELYEQVVKRFGFTNPFDDSELET